MEISSDREAEESFFCHLYRVSVSLFLFLVFAWILFMGDKERLESKACGSVTWMCEILRGEKSSVYDI